MEIFHKEVDNQSQDEQRLFWRKPDFERLTIALDTVFGSASESDGQTSGTFFVKKLPLD